MFSGRVNQLVAVDAVIAEPGRHGVIFGERGVGKTSLAAVSADIQSDHLTLRVNCDQSDNFASIWHKVGDEFRALSYEPGWDDRYPDGARIIRVATDLLEGTEVGPDQVRHFIRALSTQAPVVVYLDEFDRIADYGTNSLIADTIKTLSDQLIDATLILVGVADDVDSLIAEHHSIERALAQIPMPRMTPDEIQEIYDRGFEQLDLRIPDELKYRLVRLPQGLPHFAHRLALETSEPVLFQDRHIIHEEDLRHAVRIAIGDADESLTHDYVDATSSAHKGTLYESVLLACALAPVDELGFFSPGDLRGPLKRITGESYEIPRFARHLVQFCNDRGPVLERKGGEHRWRYRFIKPMMRPYVVMRAADDGVREDVLGLTPEPPQLPIEGASN